MPTSTVVVDLETVTNSCFVVMPFDALFDAEYERVIKRAIKAAGLQPVRGDEIYSHQSIVHDIWREIRRARLVLAELSGRNPNVMYEIGLAHAIGKPIILLTRNQEDVPFDLKALRYIYYDTNDPDWGEHLRQELVTKIENALHAPSIGTHLHGIEVRAELPAAPVPRAASDEPPASFVDVGGVWQTSWRSVKRDRPHAGTLLIPPDHGANFTAALTVTYLREEMRTIVQETLTGHVHDREVTLTGVNYTYVERGNSHGYHLDKFVLTLSDDGETLQGTVALRHGPREVIFKKRATLE